MVCEGTETEPNYFEELRIQFRIPTAHMSILPSRLGTGPEKIVEYAERKAREDGSWDEVYCLFDRDDHVHYQAALAKACSLDRRIRNKHQVEPIRFTPIPSVPCFELWFLQHFQDSSREEHRDSISRKLKVHIPGYHKAWTDMYRRTGSRFGVAVARAEMLRKRKSETNNENPSTEVDKLVLRLMDIGNIAMHSPTGKAGTR
jgi:hypothetical protein